MRAGRERRGALLVQAPSADDDDATVPAPGRGRERAPGDPPSAVALVAAPIAVRAVTVR